MFNCPVLQMNKAEQLISNGKLFLKDISELLEEFGVEITHINKRRKHISKNGEVTWSLELMFSSKGESLINLWSKIGYEYNERRSFLANVATQYLKYKRKILGEKKEAINVIIPLLKENLSYRKIALRVATGNPITERFVIDVCGKLNEGQKKIIPHVPVSFPSFQDYFKEMTRDLGKSGMIWDEIVKVDRVDHSGWVYDFTVSHPDHNFIANSFVVSNCIGGVGAFDIKEGVIAVGGVGFDISCGVRTMKTRLAKDEIEPKKEKLADALFQTVPAGLGSTGDLRLDFAEIDQVLVEGAKFTLKRGYGLEKDLEFIEEKGQVEGADPAAVSEKAKRRQFKQIGTLGSGNHYCEVQYVEQIYSKEAADAYGLFENQILISIHSGSRALGHQIGTDYLQILEQASKKYGIPIRERELVCAPFSSPEGKQYFSAVCAGSNCALANRQALGHLARAAFEKALGVKASEIELLYDISHNTARVEEHLLPSPGVADFSPRKLIVHRKGATRAFGPGRNELPEAYRKIGQPVLVGGTMGTCSFILHGTKKAMDETFGTAVHGAGRAKSRRRAKKEYWGEEVIKKLASEGIVIRSHSKPGVAEEAPGAYKDVESVVNVMHEAGIAIKVAKLKPLISIKG